MARVRDAGRDGVFCDLASEAELVDMVMLSQWIKEIYIATSAADSMVPDRSRMQRVNEQREKPARGCCKRSWHGKGEWVLPLNTRDDKAGEYLLLREPAEYNSGW